MSIYSIQARTLEGETIELSAYRGRVLLIVNTASQCAYASQLAGLQALHEKFATRGFSLLAFPCDQFNHKEPEEGEAIRRSYERRSPISFKLFDKVNVRGPLAHPLFRYLTERTPYRAFEPQDEAGRRLAKLLETSYPDIYADESAKWNYTKYLVDRGGKVQARFDPTTQPQLLESAIEALLAPDADGA